MIIKKQPIVTTSLSRYNLFTILTRNTWAYEDYTVEGLKREYLPKLWTDFVDADDKIGDYKLLYEQGDSTYCNCTYYPPGCSLNTHLPDVYLHINQS